MRTSTLAFVCAVFLSACAWGESSGGGDDDDPPPDDPPAAVCGDGTCASTEVGVCTQDCGGTSNPVCGNGSCEGPTETNATCAQDCPPSGPVCGDNVCDMAGGENSSNCPGDCTGGGSIDCNDQMVLIACVACLLDPTGCSALGVTEADCLTCAGGGGISLCEGGAPDGTCNAGAGEDVTTCPDDCQ
jgi:hypothetical protein